MLLAAVMVILYAALAWQRYLWGDAEGV